MRMRFYVMIMAVTTGLLFTSTACADAAEQSPTEQSAAEQPPATMLSCAEFLPDAGELSTPTESTPTRAGAMDAFIVEILSTARPFTNCKWLFGDRSVDFTAAWLTSEQLEALQEGWRQTYGKGLAQDATLSSFGPGARQEVHLHGHYFVTATAPVGSFMPRLVQGAAARLVAARDPK